MLLTSKSVLNELEHISKILEDINKGFDLMHEGKSIRAVVEY